MPKIKKKYEGSKYFSRTMNKMIEVSEKNISIIVKDKQKQYYDNSKTESDKQNPDNGEQSDNGGES